MNKIIPIIEKDFFKVLIKNLTQEKLYANNYKSMSILNELGFDNPRVVIKDNDDKEFSFIGYSEINEFLKKLK